MALKLAKNWADEDDDDEEFTGQVIQTAVDKDGIKTIIEYKERDGKTYKISKKVKISNVEKWTNSAIKDRKEMEKFGKAKTNSEADEAHKVTKSEEDVFWDIARKQIAQNQSENSEDKWHEQAILACESMTKEKKVWTDVNRDKQIERGADPAKPAEGAAAAETTEADKNAPAKYVPPSIKAAMGKGNGKGDLAAQQECSLRVTNLSEECREGDLQELFGAIGALQRTYLAKDPDTKQSKGFAFVTYYKREDAQKAIDRLHRYPYDNLILQVQWARPRGA